MSMVTHRESPILFSGAMVRAILDGSKTQTRRIVNPPRNKAMEYRLDGACKDGPKPFDAGEYLHVPCRCIADGEDGWQERMLERVFCPYGKPGDRLWVRETWAVSVAYNSYAPRTLTAHVYNVAYQAGGGFDFEKGTERGRWRPSIHMPRWASRITLEVTGVRVERLQEISEEDAKAEGVLLPVNAPSWEGYRFQYSKLWDSLNADRGFGWAKSPWVWAISFRRIKP